MAKINFKNQVFGRLTVLEDVGRDKYKNVLWRCNCSCGKEWITSSAKLRTGKAKSCGCLLKERKARAELTGRIFGKLMVMSLDYKDINCHTYWNCKCECGNERVVHYGNLTSGRAVSCGCTRRTHGATNTRTHKSWLSMKGRVQNPNNVDYHNYGGRGITVCDRWLGKDGFKHFLEDMGERPEGMSIDRIRNSGNYEPMNCRWATPTEQNRNTRQNILITYLGTTKTLIEWSESTGIKYVTLQKRLKAGCSINKLFNNKRFNKGELNGARNI
ncbi:hypothetical protein KAR91_51135 [Candidatus Pacearchaeota archaeon]|nr:hypothetical protein [Candidatus Pacearchaeota archaeon]